MKIKKYIGLACEANLYIISNGKTNIVIDPCVSYKTIKKDFSHIDAVLITHGHYDHISDILSYVEETKALIYCHNKVIEKFTSSIKNCSSMLSNPEVFNIDKNRIIILEEKEYKIDDMIFKVVFTPGHTNCSVTYIINDNMFTGDFLFKESIGRCDLPTGNSTQMQLSIDKIKLIKENYTIYPGHEECTTFYDELKNNYYLTK